VTEIGVEVSDERRSIANISPKEKVLFMVFVPTGNFTYPAWISGNVSLKDYPKWKNILVMATLLS